MNNKNNNLAFIFPGQGSQSIGMLSALAKDYSFVKLTFEKASQVLSKDLWALVCTGPIEDLNQTQYTQPAMLTAGFAIWQIWCENTDVRPEWMAGHSLGEYTALVCSGAISFEDAVALVSERGTLMQQAVPEGKGAMAALIGLDDTQVIDVCAENAHGQTVSAVNFNAPGQVVIAGESEAVNRVMIAAKQAGAKRAVLLSVSVPSHCSLMSDAANQLYERLEKIEIKIPDVNLIHNVDAAPHKTPEVIRTILKEQLYKPVRWVETIKFMFEQNVTTFVECGPGKVLMGLNKRIAKQADHQSIYDTETLNSVLEHYNDN